MITNKHEMYRLLNAGQLGNTLPAAETWSELTEFFAKVPPPYAVRYKQAGGRTKFNLNQVETSYAVGGLPEGTWNVSGMTPDDQRLCYGHLLDGPGGWSLHYSDEQKPCKLKEYLDGCKQKNLHGLAARMYLRGIMDQIGWETLLMLVEKYPDHVIEFSVFANSIPLTLSMSNVCFWEVRSTTGIYEKGSEWDR